MQPYGQVPWSLQRVQQSPRSQPLTADPPRCPDCLDHHKINTCGVLNLLHSDPDDPDCSSEAEESVSPEFFKDADLYGMAHVMRESPHAPHALIASVTPCSILYDDWEPYYAENPNLNVLLDRGIEKNMEYGIYRWHEPQWGHPHIMVDGRALVRVVILSRVIEAVHYFAHPGTPKTLQLFKRHFHVRNLSDDDLRDRVKKVADACVVCARSKARSGRHPDSCKPFPVPSYPFASVAMDFVSLREVKHPETGVKVDSALVIVCRLTGYIPAIPCGQQGLTSHKNAAPFLHYFAFFTGMPREIHSDNQSIISSEFYDAPCGLTGITQARSIVYRPQSNERAERAVQSIINVLRVHLVFRKLDWAYALPFALWGLNDLRGPIAPYSPHRLVFGRDPIRFGKVTPLDTVDTGVEDATKYFCRAQDERQLIQSRSADLHAREYQAFLKKHPSLQFKQRDRVLVRNRTAQPGLHPKLDRLWQGLAEILLKVSRNTYLVNLNGKEVLCRWEG